MNSVLNGKLTLSITDLKLIALVTMVIDHIGFMFFPDILTFRIIGRIAFPLFVFLIVQGFFLTSNFDKYVVRLFIIAVISEIPFNLFMFGKPFVWDTQNVCFSLLFVLLFIRFYDGYPKLRHRFLSFTVFSIIAFITKVDYLWLGILYSILFYFRIGGGLNVMRLALLFVAFSFTFIMFNHIQPIAVLSIIPIMLYDINKKDDNSFIYGLMNKSKKYYYFFYPAHMLLIFLIALVINLFV